MTKIALSGRTDVGLKRSNNEDIFIVRPELNFCLVADGMGGAAAGELASRFFAETALGIFSKAKKNGETELPGLVQKAFTLANKRILSHVKTDRSHEGMGCTAELLAFFSGGFVLGHMGDSRTYRFRNGKLKQLTHDHSLVQNMVDQGLISSEEARTHSHRNVILRAVGIEKNISLDLVKGKTLPGDLFLLCSDGLTDMVDDTLIREVLSSDISLPQKVEGFIDLAKLAGGFDNITVVLSQVM
ncbi:serine/threonine protein phosphatase [Desulfonema ishimotonii]|uniref:Serine/threonine protein phosphatase n=1 Tax=Desulfonema ishimotonii TaxID=45657 RepID=A0A401FT22_9BACT|nr:Stp1/IreP family PP2C-type Ser/Thr phosphatase [Desulfonema ishimotonii]GBC60100.1 serine/threonine protein phosphatase [Desulfonema ishimotonii]